MLSAQAFAPKIRGHWGIENPLHWSLDAVFGEDRSRLRRNHAPRNFSLLRRLSLNLLRQEPSQGSLKGKRYRAGLDNRYIPLFKGDFFRFPPSKRRARGDHDSSGT
jgi:hypothetical protein